MDYEVVDLDTVDASDPRVAYPTTTILVEDEDLFGLPRPTAPGDAHHPSSGSRLVSMMI